MADSKTGSGYTRPHNGYTPAGHAYNNHYMSRGQGVQGYNMPGHSATDLSVLAHSFHGMNMQTPAFAAQAKNALMPTGPVNYGALPVAASMPAQMYAAAAGQYVYPNGYGAGAGNSTSGMYTPHASQYMTQAAYPGYQHQEQSPYSQNWTPTTITNGEVPTLITPRRDSVSSNENDLPATPSYGAYANNVAQGGVMINRSPSGVFTQSTSSPHSMAVTYKKAEDVEISPHIKILVSQKPPIPRAIPAPSSPLKPLDRALENHRGETNVYIRGLLPETSDDMLEAWGSRFGDIKSSKSIIDLNTGLCKGFGFVKYHNYEDANNCIRGFHYLGYEVSFARESFYSKLKAFAEPGNTNLYVSNLPKSMNEHELAQLFHPHAVISSRILRDRNGHGRGVGFARFDSRDTCENVIKIFNNHTIKTNGEELQIQIRYADTKNQKELKQATQAARQFRSQEYEYATQAWRHSLESANTGSADQNGNEFEKYLGTTAGVPIHGQRWAQLGLRQAPGRSSSSNSTACASGSNTFSAQLHDAAGSGAHNTTETDSAVIGDAPTTSATVAHDISAVDSGDASDSL